jgi:hypothetical protein
MAAQVPFDSIGNGLRTNNRVSNTNLASNRARRRLGQLEVAIDAMSVWIDLENDIACCGSYIYIRAQ